MFPSSAPQKIFSRALTRSAAVRPRYRRSNCCVDRGIGGNRRRARSLGVRARPPPVPSSELRRRPRDRREPPQVQLAGDPRLQPVGPPRITPLQARAVPALVPCRAAVFQRPAVLLIADVGPPVPNRRVTNRVV